jgi:hypothetical protein
MAGGKNNGEKYQFLKSPSINITTTHGSQRSKKTFPPEAKNKSNSIGSIFPEKH